MGVDDTEGARGSGRGYAGWGGGNAPVEPVARVQAVRGDRGGRSPDRNCGSCGLVGSLIGGEGLRSLPGVDHPGEKATGERDAASRVGRGGALPGTATTRVEIEQSEPRGLFLLLQIKLPNLSTTARRSPSPRIRQCSL